MNFFFKRLLLTKKKAIVLLIGTIILVGISSIPFGSNNNNQSTTEKQNPITKPNIGSLPVTILESPKLIQQETRIVENNTQTVEHTFQPLSIEAKEDVMSPKGVARITAKGFNPSSHVDILFNEIYAQTRVADYQGIVHYVQPMPERLGTYTITMDDNQGNSITKAIQIKEGVEKPIKEKTPEDRRGKEGIMTTFTTDFFPPVTNVTISGNYSNISNWYYGPAPIASFIAHDELSGVKGIHAFYKKCGYPTYECILENGGSITLDRQTEVNKGHIVIPYYAIDNDGHKEEEKRLDIWYDGIVPDIYLMKIFTQTQKNIPIGSECKTGEVNTRNCVLINVVQFETLTFELLASDKVSGINATLYRITQSFSSDVSWKEGSSPTKGYAQIRLTFPQTGLYKVQFKCNDIAGNESEIKSFTVRVNPS